MCKDEIHLFEHSAVFRICLRRRRPSCAPGRIIFSAGLDSSLPRRNVVQPWRAEVRLQHIEVRILSRGLIGYELQPSALPEAAPANDTTVVENPSAACTIQE